MNRSTFNNTVKSILNQYPQRAAEGGYATIYFDITRFKAINDIFGMDEGDRLLKYIASIIRSTLTTDGCSCRIGSDRFVLFINTSNNAAERFVERLRTELDAYDIAFEVTFNAGIFVTGREQLSADAMVDRAILAQSSIKGSYTISFNYYTEALRDAMLGEQEIVGLTAAALNSNQFVAYYQPQYNHSTGMLVGAEALVRWIHPEKGMVSPGVFIPIFEKNGFITKLDLYVFEQTCIFLRKCMDNHLPIVPISTNFSRYDIFNPRFVELLEEIRTKYDIPVKYLRIELTESAIIGGTQHINDVISRLHKHNYIVEMDDFGSGYSSLNVLKDIDLDIIKLDMKFFSSGTGNNKGGTIVSSVVRMAKWLSMPVIAEGVETIAQADFLKSIGCNYIQGYLYSRPLPEQEYIRLLNGSSVGATVPQMKLIETLNAFDFWNPESMETLIFSNYVGGAAIFDYYNGKAEILRINKKYLEELLMNLTEQDIIKSDPMAMLDDESRPIYTKALEKAIETGEEQECETWRTISSECCGVDRICIRSVIRMVGKSEDRYLFYATIRNITAEKLQQQSILDSEKRFKMASEQINIYYWEYNILTKEMRPCFRCMRDLGLPPLIRNYPEPVIENGTFPPEVADMYRDWHKQVENGVESLEAVIPLTMNRIPFRVRYTTEFDENGRPIKAYGSAALIVE